MKRRLLVALGIVVAACVAIVLALPALVNLSAVKGRAVAALSAATGRRVTIDHLRLALFPWLGVRLDGAVIGNAPGFGAAPLATVDDAVVEVRLLPLLDKRLVIRRIVLTHLTLNLETRGSGVDNWRFTTAKSAPSSTPAQSAAEAREAPVFKVLQAAGLSVRDATVRYTDLAQHKTEALSHLFVHTGAIALNRPIQITASGRLHTASLGAPFRLTTQATISQGHYRLSPFHFELATLALDGDIEAATGSGGIEAHGTVRVPRFAPRPLFKALDLHYVPTSPKAWTRVSAHAAFTYGPAGFLLAPLVFHLDDSTMTGRLGLDSRTHIYRADLDIDRFAPGRYLPAATPAKAAPAPTAQVPAAHAPSALDTLVVRGLLRIGQLTWKRVVLTHVTVPLDLDHGLARLDPVHADLYGGSFAGHVVANEALAVPPVSLGGQLQGVQVGPLLRATGLTRAFSGVLRGQAQLHAQGRSAAAIERTLTGQANLAIDHGMLRGLDLDFIASDPRIAAGTHRLKKVAGTAFQNLRASATLVNGVAHTNDLYMKTSRAVVHGQGTIDLPNRSLDYLLRVSLPSGFTVPVNVQGPFGHMRFGIAVGRLLGEPGTQKKLHSAVRHLGHTLENIFGLH